MIAHSVVLLLGSLHIFMNLLGAIGTLMIDSGLIVHNEWKCSTASISWTPAGGSGLTCQIVAKIMEDNRDFQDQVKAFYTLIRIEEMTWNPCCSQIAFAKLTNI